MAKRREQQQQQQWKWSIESGLLIKIRSPFQTEFELVLRRILTLEQAGLQVNATGTERDIDAVACIKDSIAEPSLDRLHSSRTTYTEGFVDAICSTPHRLLTTDSTTKTRFSQMFSDRLLYVSVGSCLAHEPVAAQTFGCEERI